MTCLTDLLLRLPTRLLRCCRSCITGAQGGELYMRGFFWGVFPAGGLSPSLAASLLFKGPGLTLQFYFHQRLVLGKNSSLGISLVCTLFPAPRKRRSISHKTGRLISRMQTFATIMWAPCGLFVLLCAHKLEPFIFYSPAYKLPNSMLNRWKAEH